MQAHKVKAAIAQADDDSQLPFWDDLYRQMYGDKILRIERVEGSDARQRKGIDRIIHLATGESIRVEEKLIKRHYYNFVVEYSSSIEPYRPGWAVNDEYETDLLVYGKRAAGKFYVFKYPEFRALAKAMESEWDCAYGYKIIPNDAEGGRSYETQIITVPDAVMMAAISMQVFEVPSAKISGTPLSARSALGKRKPNALELRYRHRLGADPAAYNAERAKLHAIDNPAEINALISAALEQGLRIDAAGRFCAE